MSLSSNRFPARKRNPGYADTVNDQGRGGALGQPIVHDSRSASTSSMVISGR